MAIESFLHQRFVESLPIGKSRAQMLLEDLGLYNRWQLWGPLRKPLYRVGLLFSEDGPGRVVSVGGDYERAWPGATALSMLAGVHYFDSTTDDSLNIAIHAWKDGLLALHVTGRGFREAPHYLSESAYVNGEAWLALAEYTAMFPSNQQTLDFLYELDEYMLEYYRRNFSVRFYSWGTMAAARRWASTGDPRFLEFAVYLTEQFLDLVDSQSKQEENNCAQVEGLATFVGLMGAHARSEEALVQRAVASIDAMMTFNRHLQIDADFRHRAAIDNRYARRLHDYRGAFVESLGNPHMRIDLTQHCMSALLQMQRAGLGQ